MASTSGTRTFNPTIDELIDAAYLRVGGDHVTGRDAQTSRRALNIMLIDLINRGVPLATLEEFSTTVTTSVTSYDLDANIIDVIQPAVLMRASAETQMTRLPLADFKALPRKDQPGKPNQYTTHRDTSVVSMYVWPMPENSTDIIKYWAVTKIQDVTLQDQLVDLPTRYLPAIISGLAYYLSLEKVGEDLNRVQMLKMEYEETLQRALDEDRERTSFFIRPALGRIIH